MTGSRERPEQSPGERTAGSHTRYPPSTSSGRVATALLLVRLEEPGLIGEHDRLDTVTEVELLEDVRHVRLDRGLADVQLPRDLGVREAPGDQAKDISFALAEIGEFLRMLAARGAGELLDHPSCDRG